MLFSSQDLQHAEAVAKTSACNQNAKFDFLQIGLQYQLSANPTKKELAAQISRLNVGESCAFYTKGAWSLHEVIAAIIGNIGKADLWLSTWTITEHPLRALLQLIEAGSIGQFNALFDHRIERRASDQLAFASGINARIGLVKCHAKIVVLQNESYHFAVIGSANLSKNPRLESGLIIHDKELANFYAKLIDQEIEDYERRATKRS